MALIREYLGSKRGREETGVGDDVVIKSAHVGACARGDLYP